MTPRIKRTDRLTATQWLLLAIVTAGFSLALILNELRYENF